ncbi:hypothetical protein, partial [Aeromonas veronii]|uniref:hypothetical protein n=1 Tax=Aeromonas veronii TaxID=654 RepID=UPI0029DCCB41
TNLKAFPDGKAFLLWAVLSIRPTGLHTRTNTKARLHDRAFVFLVRYIANVRLLPVGRMAR